MAQENQDQHSETTEIVRVESRPAMSIIPIAEIQARVQAIKQLLAQEMKRGIDYDTIPGCGDKPALLQPGSQLICMMFQLAPSFEFTISDLPGGHREYECICTLRSGDRFAGQGTALCSSHESKYRYRGTQVTPTDRPVPREFWDCKKAGQWKKAQELIGGERFTTKKIDGNWKICEKTAEKMENENPADTFNTIKKMAAKRALVAATLTVTGASRVFSQDPDYLESLIQEGLEMPDRDQPRPPEKTPARRDSGRQPKREDTKSGGGGGNAAGQVVGAFAREFNIQSEHLVRRVGKAPNLWTKDDVSKLRDDFAKLRSGEMKVDDFAFGTNPPPAQDEPRDDDREDAGDEVPY